MTPELFLGGFQPEPGGLTIVCSDRLLGTRRISIKGDGTHSRAGINAVGTSPTLPVCQTAAMERLALRHQANVFNPKLLTITVIYTAKCFTGDFCET